MPAPNRDTHNQSLDRGITVLETIATLGACSLADLHRQTGLPKSSLRRLLGTLTRRRLVRKSLSDGRYRSNCALPVTTSHQVAPHLALFADMALPVIMELTEQIKWPSDIHTFDGTWIDVLDSTRTLSPFHLYAGLINRRVSLFGSAAGQACLMHLTDDQIIELVLQHAGDPVFGLQRFHMDIPRYLDRIGAMRAQGYATRLPGFVGETTTDDGLSSIALAVLQAGTPVGAVSVVWPRTLLTPDTFAETALPVMRSAVARINQDIARLSPEST